MERMKPGSSLDASSMASTVKRFIGAVEDEWELFSDREADYTIGPPIGFGASSIVYSATYQPQPATPSPQLLPPIPCALKVVDLDALRPRSLSLLQRETNLMSLSKHPNVLRVRGSWITGHKLFIALRLMNKGSAADVMHYGWPGGMEEDVIVCMLRQALEGLNYLHVNGFIHRDIKAANLLVDDDGTVLLGDLGVAADLAEDLSLRLPSLNISVMSASSSFTQAHSHGTDNYDAHPKRVVLFDHNITPTIERPRVGKRKSFVGTPCWMAPELIQGRQYDASADIWSFGITALELSRGRPPRSKETPQQVLLRTIQDDPPTLDREGGVYKYSRAFKEVIDWCLNKDPAKRPTCEDLLQTPLFRAAKKKSYLVGAILKDLPPLALRQERRALKNAHTLLTLDSWDFATTVHSPITIPSRRPPTDFIQFESDVSAGSSEIEDNQFTSAVGRRSRPISSIGAKEQDERDFSSSDSDASSALADSGPASSGHEPSPPSSIFEFDSQEAPLEVRDDVSPGLGGEKSASKTITHCASSAFIVPSQTVQTMPVSRSSSHKAVLSSPPHHTQSGFWTRLKMNVRRSTSRNNLLASPKYHSQ